MTEDKIILAQDNKLTMSRQNFTTIENAAYTSSSKKCVGYMLIEIWKNTKAHKDLVSDMYLTLNLISYKCLGMK